MNFVGFYLTKISAERFLSSLDGVNVTFSINISSVEDESSSEKGEERILAVSFKYFIDYTKNIAKLEFGGKIFVSVDPKTAKEFLGEWKKQDSQNDLKIKILNAVLVKTNIKALEIEDNLGLPPHFNLPSLALPTKK